MKALKIFFLLFIFIFCFFSYSYIYNFQIEIAKDGTLYAHWESSKSEITGGIIWGEYFDNSNIETPNLKYKIQSDDKKPSKFHRIVINKYVEPEKHYVFYAYDFDINAKEKIVSLELPLSFTEIKNKIYKYPLPVRSPRIAFRNPNALIFDIKSTDKAKLNFYLLYEDKIVRTLTFSPAKRFSFRIDGLKNNTIYKYRFELINPKNISIKYSSPTYTVKSYKTKDKDFSFCFASDSRSSANVNSLYSYNGVAYPILRKLMISALKDDIDFIIFGGDLVSGYTSDYNFAKIQFQTWCQAVTPVWKFVPIYPTVGNHDATAPRYANSINNCFETLWRDIFVLPTNGVLSGRNTPDYLENTYSFTYGNAYFIVLNPYYNSSNIGNTNTYNKIGEKQLEWLKGNLMYAVKKDYKYIIVILHTPPFPVGPHLGRGIDRDKKSRDEFWKLLDKFNVDMVLCGHEHMYVRINIDKNINPEFKHSIPEIISGRAGAPYYPLNPKCPYKKNILTYSPEFHYCKIEVDSDKGITLKVYDRYHQLIDKASFKPRKRDKRKLLVLKEEKVKITKVIDGDTVVDDKGRHIRLLGIDTPETEKPWKNLPAEPFSHEATDFTKSLILGKEVLLQYDVSEKDRYGRTLAYIFVKDKNGKKIFVQEELVKKGYAYVYTIRPNLFYKDRLEKAQWNAYKKKLGIWSENRKPEKFYYADYYFFKYHRPSCKSVNQIELPYRIKFHSKDEAVKSGRGPCRGCKP